MSHIQNIIESFKGFSVENLRIIIASAKAAANNIKKAEKAAAKKAEKAENVAADETEEGDGRHNSGAIAKKREMELVRIMNHGVDDNLAGIFPCSPSNMREFLTTIREMCTGFRQAVHAGGLQGHHDIEIQTDAKNIRVELKVNKKKSSHVDVLRWTPWVDTVQFLQGQLKSKIGHRFLDSCGETMIDTWFMEVVQPFSTKVPAANGMTVAGYKKAMWTIKMKGSQEEAAKAFIAALRTDEALQQEIHTLWLDFEVRWFSSHQPDVKGLEEVVRDILESKDAWICVSKNQVQWVEGLKVIHLEYTGTAPKRDGGMLFTYNLTLQSGDETKIVPIECKFHWKNGGQGVQNINFMLV